MQYARQRRHIRSGVATVLDTLEECGYDDTGNNSGFYHDEESVAEKGGLLSNGNRRHWSSPSSLVSSEPSPTIIIHTFSNGGTNTATQLLLELHRRLPHSPLPLRGLLLDSGPAKGTYWKSYNAMVLSLPRDAASQILGALAVHFLLTLLYTWIACGNENPASLMRRTLLNEDISKVVSKDNDADVERKGRVCYLYSKADEMVEWTDVREHAEEARKKGWEVHEEVFEGSVHCAHFSADSARYVNAVKTMWMGCMGSPEEWTNLKIKTKL